MTQIPMILERKIFRALLDVIILANMPENGPTSGYDIMKLCQKKFGIKVSPSTIYSILFKLEKDRLIQGGFQYKKRVYSITKEGKRNLSKVTMNKEKLRNFFDEIINIK
ncbi:MAG: PadR family transcriptional regulator [Candidatus Bathyarchaeota archaeon]|nr:MAG: PadR family transcriptional regulator [Candidatus Bathyarchaeota archaeon]